MERCEKEFILPCSVSSRMAYSIAYSLNALKSDFYVIKGNKSANAKSIIGLLNLGCTAGDKVIICCLNKSKDVAEFDLVRAIELFCGGV